jgi:hypothetical protein
MSSSDLVRWGGWAAVVAGALLVVGELMYLVTGLEQSAAAYSSAPAFVQNVLFLMAGVLLVGGLISLYVGRLSSTLGIVAFVVAFVGTVLVAGSLWDSAFTVTALAGTAPELYEAGPPGLVLFGLVLSFVLFSLGWLLFGVAVLRSRTYSRGSAILLMAGAVLAFFPFPFTFIPFGLAVSWMGSSLLLGRTTVTERPTRVS